MMEENCRNIYKESADDAPSRRRIGRHCARDGVLAHCEATLIAQEVLRKIFEGYVAFEGGCAVVDPGAWSDIAARNSPNVARREVIAPCELLAPVNWLADRREVMSYAGNHRPYRFAPKWLGAICLGALILAGRADGGVLQTGSVVPADNPFTEVVEGLPPNGTFINPFEGDPDNPQASDQSQFELLPGNEDGAIIVGETSFGAVQIDGGSEIRSENLIIGASGERGGFTRFGTGVMRITGFGSLYNNDPTILPYGLVFEEFGTIRDVEAGYDLFVGDEGNGTLEISFGGRAEIQDAVVVGNTGSAIGSLIVTGADSFLGSGGFEAGAINTTDPHAMIIGRLGTGQMHITEGGIVYALAPSTTEDEAAVAAAIGGNPYIDSDIPEAGGQGYVVVDGPGSKWIVGGTLQVGAFHNSTIGDIGGEDPAGLETVYGNTIGRGTLTVSNQGTVTVLYPSDGTTTNIDDLDMVIGRFGRVMLDGGLVEVLGGFETGEDPDPEIDNVRVINDGLISGDGTISTGRFQNRVLGQVRVGAGQKLLVNATGRFNATLNQEPMINYGLMEIVGNAQNRAEIEFDRADSSVSNDQVRPFINARLSADALPLDNGGREYGLIMGQESTLRFRSGLLNQGQLSFTAGNNIVSGSVVNAAADVVNSIDEGVITISGNDTSVIFQDDLFNDGIIDVAPNASLMTVLGDFVNGATGTVQLTLGGGESGSELSYLQIGQDAILNGTLQVDLFASGANPIIPMAGDRYEIMSAAGDLVGVFTNQLMPDLGPDLDMFPVYDYVADTVTLTVASLIGVIGADFNGDGIVDRNDLSILQMNLGIAMNASPAQGDADGDGDIDGTDFFIWQQQFGGAGMAVPGAGSGAGLPSGAVPEPSSFVLVLLSGMLAVVARGRRRR